MVFQCWLLEIILAMHLFRETIQAGFKHSYQPVDPAADHYMLGQVILKLPQDPLFALASLIFL